MCNLHWFVSLCGNYKLKCKEKPENGQLALLGNDHLLSKNSLHSCYREHKCDKLINLFCSVLRAAAIQTSFHLDSIHFIVRQPTDLTVFRYNCFLFWRQRTRDGRSAPLRGVKVFVTRADVRIICPLAIAGHWIPRTEALLCFFKINLLLTMFLVWVPLECGT